MENLIGIVPADDNLSGQAHALLEYMLGGKPRLQYGAHGKPVLEGREDLHFNLSHTSGLVVCALSAKPCGVDVEHTGRVIRPAAAKRCFTPAELAWAQGEAQRWVLLWTRKEALLKWKGVLEGPLSALETTGHSLLCTVEAEGFFLSFCGEPPAFRLVRPDGKGGFAPVGYRIL